MARTKTNKQPRKKKQPEPEQPARKKTLREKILGHSQEQLELVDEVFQPVMNRLQVTNKRKLTKVQYLRNIMIRIIARQSILISKTVPVLKDSDTLAAEQLLDEIKTMIEEEILLL